MVVVSHLARAVLLMAKDETLDSLRAKNARMTESNALMATRIRKLTSDLQDMSESNFALQMQLLDVTAQVTELNINNHALLLTLMDSLLPIQALANASNAQPCNAVNVHDEPNVEMDVVVSVSTDATSPNCSPNSQSYIDCTRKVVGICDRLAAMRMPMGSEPDTMEPLAFISRFDPNLQSQPGNSVAMGTSDLENKLNIVDGGSS